jgi:uncharacterized protein (DUF1800 family)
VTRKLAPGAAGLAWTALLLAAFLYPGLAHGAKKIKIIKPGANPPQYAAFSRLLPKEERYRHALERLTFGPRPGDLDEIRRLGLDKWLNLQLHPERVPENPVLTQRLQPYESLRMSLRDVALRYAQRPGQAGQIGKLPDDPVERRRAILSANPPAVIAEDLEESKLLRAIYSNHQLEELLVDFWYNHFNVFWGKGQDRFYVPAYERDAIRPHVFGKFYDLLLATAQSPAMLFYLDNWQSVGPNSFAARFARGRNRRGLNENYGRELLELHTLGVDGGYTQRDVIEVARCFTGWTLAPPRRGGGFEYNDRMHDKGPKMVLGHLIRAGGGMEDGLEVLRILAHHPATAHHISFELAQRFVADDPPPSLVNRMAETFLKTDGDLRRVMETMLESGEFWSEGAYHAKLKTPFEMVVSVVRVTGADVQSALPLARETARLGEPLYRKVEPNGYANVNAEWASSAGLLERMNFALAVAQNRMPGVHVEPGYWEQLTQGDPKQAEDLLLGEEASPQTQAAIHQALQAMPQARPEQTLALVAGLTLGSPEFQKR